MKKKINYAEIMKETGILTVAVAIIAAAVYFFLVPSHASVSSISGLGIVLSTVGHYDDHECSASAHRLCHLRERIRGKDGVHQCDAAGILRTFRDAVSEFRFHDRQSGAGRALLYSGGQRGTEHSV